MGNATMRDLFFGLDVAPIGHSPFRSVTETAWRAGAAADSSVVRLAHELGILVHPRARVWGAPLIACHVGADAAADLLPAGMLEAADPATSGGPAMLIDVGTNTEVVITDGTRVLAASCPAGPAFEGGLVRFGMPGSEGAIEAVRHDGGAWAVRTIGDVEPEGICGSGLVDVLAELRRIERDDADRRLHRRQLGGGPRPRPRDHVLARRRGPARPGEGGQRRRHARPPAPPRAGARRPRPP